MKKNLRREFQRGFALSTQGELLAVIDAYKNRTATRNELRCFAAKLEKSAMHKESMVDLARIVNKRSGMKGIRRLSHGEIERAGECVSGVLRNGGEFGDEPSRPKAISRKALQHIAQGRCTKVEAILLLMYFLKRISQAKPLQKLDEGERYARFRFSELTELSGIPKANLSRALRKLEEKGFLGTVDVAKQNENTYGLCFVDGPSLSLVRVAQLTRRERRLNRQNETTTPSRDFDNAPPKETTTLRKEYPKRVHNKRGKETLSSSGRCTQEDWDRILRRAAQMKAEFLEQAA